MPLLKYASIVLFISWSIVGCGLTEGVVQKDSASYLWFTGNTENAVVYIDDSDPISLSGSDNTTNSKKTHYKIASGKHNIIVEKDDNVVVNRKVLLGNGITKEINIP